MRVFVKKTEKTPRREIERALSRAKSRITDLHKKWLKEPKYKKAYDALEEEFVLASAVMEVRNRAGLTQEELARKMGTTQPVVARLESGRGRTA